VKFTSENSDYFYEKLVDKFFKNEQDVDLFKYHYNPIRMMDLVVDVHDSLSTSRIRVGRKKYNEVNIDSHDDGYNMTFDNSISDVFIL
jgi:dipeptidase